MVLFGVEYSITLLLALFTGLILIELALPTFRELSEIKLDNMDIYLAAIKYTAIVASLSFLLSLYPIYYFRQKTLNAMLKGSTGSKSKNIFQKVSMVAQFCDQYLFYLLLGNPNETNPPSEPGRLWIRTDKPGLY